MILPLVGELNRRATFTSKRHVPGSNNGFAAAEVTTFTVWAKVEAVGSATFWGSMQINQTTTHRIWVRRVEGKTRPEDFSRITDILVDGMKFRARRVADVGDRRRFTCIECEQLGVV